MSTAWLSLTAYIVNAVWQISLIGAVGWGLSRWLKRAGPELQHQVWVAVLLLSTLAPATPIFQRYFAHQASTGEGIGFAPLMPGAVGGRTISLTGSHIVLHPTAIYLVCGLYVAALLFFLIRLGWALHGTAALIRNAGPSSMDADYAAMWNRSKEKFFVRTAALVRSPELPGPVTAGFWRPVLLLPASFIEQHSRTEFLAAIGHECAHIQRDDFRKNVFYEVVALLTAFHPMTWFIKSQIAQTREMVCDRMAAEGLLDRRTYGESLLQLATKMPQAGLSAVFNTIGMFDTHILERRIMTLMTSAPRVSRIGRYSLGAIAMVLLAICAGVGGSFTQPVSAQTSALTAQTDSAGKKADASKDLSCTYYDKAIGSPGTCGYDQQDKTKYRCYSNQYPAKSQTQIGCEWKVKRAEGARQ
jgi:beta-lactamase regulating signal transducer with metallopeptidase domain